MSHECQCFSISTFPGFFVVVSMHVARFAAQNQFEISRVAKHVISDFFRISDFGWTFELCDDWIG